MKHESLLCFHPIYMDMGLGRKIRYQTLSLLRINRRYNIPFACQVEIFVDFSCIHISWSPEGKNILLPFGLPITLHELSPSSHKIYRI